MSRYLRQYSSTLEILLIGTHLAYEIHRGPRGLKNELVFDPWLGLLPFSVVGDELQEPRLAHLGSVQVFVDGQRKITKEKKIRKLLKMAPLILVPSR